MINLLKGDCLELMKQIPDGSIDAIITDPPYGTTACKWDSVIDFDLMWEHLNRIIKPNGAIVLFGSEPFSSALRMSNIKNYKYDWYWDKVIKTGFLNAKKQPLRQVENISVFYNKQSTYNPLMTKGIAYVVKSTGNKSSVYGGQKDNIETVCNGEKFPNNIIIVNKKTNDCHPSKTFHPTQKPVELMEYLIKTYTNENETVLDFTMGSGSTGVACRNINRSFIGIEMDEKYFEIATNRINK
jgi:DNA modification methylase